MRIFIRNGKGGNSESTFKTIAKTILFHMSLLKTFYSYLLRTKMIIMLFHYHVDGFSQIACGIMQLQHSTGQCKIKNK